MARAAFSLSSTMGPSTLSARTMRIRSPGALPHPTTTLMACGDTALVSTLCGHNRVNHCHLRDFKTIVFIENGIRQILQVCRQS